MRRLVAGLLRRTADRLAPGASTHCVVHQMPDPKAVQDMLLQLKRRNGMGMF